MELRCVHCGLEVRRLLVQYSPGNIRLMKCDNCKAVADPYVECEFMILLIDLILHKQKAYRHLLYNMMNQDAIDSEGLMWKSSLIYSLSDACRNILLSKSKEGRELFKSSSFSIGICGKMLLDVLLGNFVFFGTLLLANRILLSSSFDIARCKAIFLGILVSSYFKMFLIAMLVWEFPSAVPFIIDIFVLSSNTVALKVLTQLPVVSCIGVSLSAHAAKLLATALLQTYD